MARLQWYCEACAEVIGNGKGYVTCQPSLLPRRSTVWHAYHGDCDPRFNSFEYWVDVARLRSWSHVLCFTLHFLDTKDWISTSNWSRFLFAATRTERPFA